MSAASQMLLNHVTIFGRSKRFSDERSSDSDVYSEAEKKRRAEQQRIAASARDSIYPVGGAGEICVGFE